MNKKAIYIISSSVLLAAAIGLGIYIYRKKNNKDKNSNNNTDQATKKQDEQKQQVVEEDINEQEKYNFSTTTSHISNKKPAELSSVEGVKDFQDWLDIYHPTWLKGGRLNKGKGYGNFGNNTQKAWDKYGDEYLNYKNKINEIANKIIQIINNSSFNIKERANRVIEVLKNNQIQTKKKIKDIENKIIDKNKNLWEYLTTKSTSFKEVYDKFIENLI